MTTDSSIIYFPKSQFSKRYGEKFFTFKVEGFHVVDNGCCQRYAVYEILVLHGDKQWKINRRFSEFYNLGSKYLASGVLPTVSVVGHAVTLPAKTWRSKWDDENFLLQRKMDLEDFLDNLLKQLGQIKEKNVMEDVKEFLQLKPSV